ncbi:MAG: FGGY-family carbohydrate kinase [Thermomicrobiales bacterium]
MTGSLLIGVDIGTASSKGVLCTPDGEVVASAVIEHQTSFPRPGWAEHDADKIWWNEFAAICRQLLSGPYSGNDVGGVAVSAIGPCMLPVDAMGSPLRPAVLYGIDSRATAEIAWLEEHFGAEEMFALGGSALTSQAVGPKIRWLRQHEPEVFARTAMIQSSSGYVVFRLTGNHVVDRHTASYYTPLFDLEQMKWSSTFADQVIDPSCLPEIRESHEIAGEVTAAASAETGLQIGTPVTVGTMDAAAEALSAGIDDAGDMLIMYGSTLFLVNLSDSPRPDRRIWNTAYCLPGTTAITGGLGTSGLLTTWFRDLIGGGGVAPGNDNPDPSSYAALAARAAEIPAGCDGLVCLPYFAGERNPLHDPEARGMFAGLTLRHTQGHLYRSLLEAVGYGFRHNLDVHREIGAMPKRIVSVGGGTKNELWVQILSDISGITQFLPERTIGASYGDAFLAGLGTGIIDNSGVLNAQWVRIARQIEPNPAMAEVYDQTYAIYRNLYEHAKDDLHALHRLDLGSSAPISIS